MDQITLAGLDPEQLNELQQRITTEISKRIGSHNAAYAGSEVDRGGWYETAMNAAAAVVALEFKLARGE